MREDSIAGRMQLARKRKKITQEKIADLLSISAVAYGHYERGRNEISLERLKKFSEIVDVSLEWLLTGEGRMIEDRGEAREILKVIRKLEKERLHALNVVMKQMFPEEFKDQDHP